MDHSILASYNSASSAGSSSKANRNRINKEKKGSKKCKGVRLSTDPQSVAARERRHRISDRFKILQSMVPGGSKMDTVSMLEEAIQYVKFLKTQILLHQTMINFFDDNVNDSLSTTYLNNDCYLPSQDFIISPQQNLSVDYNMQSLPQPHIPLAQCSFQGEDTTYFDMMPL